ncbi:defensin Ec-AMP-D2-like [Senna tora]|uniref:Defensin Ec-AMP-D2-like n=1 Tax=Senna tora TaxID=362788 RepID=A0A835C9F9_9FABA|nr:defensin Ec-AMP-D2-like [Senna tora]
MEKARFGLFFLLLILIASRKSHTEEMVMQGEARHCESKSHRFKGMCMSDHNCASVCLVEGFTGGKCRGFRHRCFCTKVC